MNGDLLDERDDEETPDFVPSKGAKHRPPKNLKKVPQERPKKQTRSKKNNPPVNPTMIDSESDKALSDTEDSDKCLPKGRTSDKTLPQREGRGFNPCYGGARNFAKKKRLPSKKNEVNNNDIPKDIEEEFLKANRVFYVVLSPRYKKSEKQITYCCGCGGRIKLHEKRFPNNLVFRYRARHMVPENGNKNKWVMSQECQNCYFHLGDLDCLHKHYELADIQIKDVYMDNKSFNMLKEENKEELRWRNHWDALIDGRECIKLTGCL